MINNRVVVVFWVLLTLVACAGFSYRYYGVDVEQASPEKGVLRGPKAEDDLPMTVCLPTIETKSPCVMMKADEFFKMRRDYIDLKKRLESCEKAQI